MTQPVWKMVWRLLKKLGIKPPCDPAISLLSIYPEETRVEKDTCIPLFIAALFTIARTWKQTRCPLTDEWIKRVWCIYTMEYYSAINRNTFESVLTRWMNLEPIIQSEVSLKEKDKYSLVAETVKRLSTMRETRVRSLGWEDPLEKEMAIHSRTIAWKIPWREEPGRLQSMGS